MPDHPSLTAAPTPIPRLKQSTRLAAGAPCWCRSKKPFGACHRHREHAKSQHPKAFAEVIKRLKLPRVCAHPDAPHGCRKIIDAHTIQKRGGLDALAEASHVTEFVLDDGVLDEAPRGIHIASTFEGFCGTHDNNLFEPVETKPRRVDIVAFYLFAFRALAYTRHRQAIALERVARYRVLDAGLTLSAQARFQRRILAMEMGATRTAEDITAIKDSLNRMYRSRNYSGFRAAGWLFSELLPLAYSGAFYPEYDLRGIPLQRLGHGNAAFEMICATLTPWDGKTLLVLAWIGEPDGPAERYVRSLHALADDQKANAAMHAGFEDQENLMMRPSWWDKLSRASRDALKAMRMAGTETGPSKGPRDFNKAQPVLSAAAVDATYYFDGANP